MAIAGKDFKLYRVIDGTPVLYCHARDCVINIDAEEVETSGPNSPWQTFEYGYLGYGITAPGVTVYQHPLNVVQFQETQIARQKFDWQAGTHVPGGLVYSGTCIIPNTSQSSQWRDAVLFDLTLRGTGPLVIAKLPITKTVYLADMQGVRLAGCPNPYPVGVLWYDGSFIGVAENADDVIAIFNAYSATVGNYFVVTGALGGCDFTMQIAWDAPFEPDWIIAEPGAGFVIGVTGLVGDNDVLGVDGISNDVIGVTD